MGIHNQNKVPNYAIGDNTSSVRGTDDTANVHMRSKTTYNKTNLGKFTNQFIDSNGKAKNMRQWIDSNKFEYGHDPNGGIKAGPPLGKTDPPALDVKVLQER